AGAVLGAGVHLVHGFQVKRNAKVLLEEATEAEQNNQPSKALECLGLYLGLQPQDNDALARYGTLLNKVAKSPRGLMQALFALEKVLRAEPDRTDVRREAIEVSLKLGRYNDAQDHLKSESIKALVEKDVELKKMEAACLEGEGKYDEANK